MPDVGLKSSIDLSEVFTDIAERTKSLGELITGIVQSKDFETDDKADDYTRNNCSISLNTMELASIGGQRIGHDYLVLENSAFEGKFEVHGIGINPSTGQIAMSGDKTTLVAAMTIGPPFNHPVIRKQELWRGNCLAYTKAICQIWEAAAAINSQKLAYVAFDGTGGQNSNSVASTLAKIVGLPIPSSEDIWTPGTENDLLSGWTPVIAPKINAEIDRIIEENPDNPKQALAEMTGDAFLDLEDSLPDISLYAVQADLRLHADRIPSVDQRMGYNTNSFSQKTLFNP